MSMEKREQKLYERWRILKIYITPSSIIYTSYNITTFYFRKYEPRVFYCLSSNSFRGLNRQIASSRASFLCRKADEKLFLVVHIPIVNES